MSLKRFKFLILILEIFYFSCFTPPLLADEISPEEQNKIEKSLRYLEYGKPLSISFGVFDSVLITSRLAALDRLSILKPTPWAVTLLAQNVLYPNSQVREMAIKILRRQGQLE